VQALLGGGGLACAVSKEVSPAADSPLAMVFLTALRQLSSML
jgi:hypothetical protein